jgi:hypothetical protein
MMSSLAPVLMVWNSTISAAQRLVDAAHLLAEEPVSIQLRYLQTLTEIGVEKNTTVVFPVPVDIFSRITRSLGEI